MVSQVQKSKIHNKDVFQRVNFLKNASLLMANKNRTLSCYYGNLFKQIQKKSVLKIDPSIKRNLCSRCAISFTSETCELSAEDRSVGVVKCVKCGFEKIYPINDSYKLWNEREVSAQEIIEITCDKK